MNADEVASHIVYSAWIEESGIVVCEVRYSPVTPFHIVCSDVVECCCMVRQSYNR